MNMNGKIRSCCVSICNEEMLPKYRNMSIFSAGKTNVKQKIKITTSRRFSCRTMMSDGKNKPTNNTK